MPEARHTEIEVAEPTEAHDPLTEVFIRRHQSDAEDVRRRVPHEQHALFRDVKHQMSLRVTWSMEHSDTTGQGNPVPVRHEHVGPGRRDLLTLRRDNPSVKHRVQEPGRRNQTPHRHAPGHEHGVPPVHVDPGPGQSLHFCHSTGVVRVTVGHQDVSDLGNGPSHGVNPLADGPRAPG